jgi:hypothetical protein
LTGWRKQLVSSRDYGQKDILMATKTSTFLEYLKIHKISLEQDLEDARNNIPLNEDEYFESDAYYTGAIDTMEHILSVATDIMNSSNERYE